MFIAALKLDLLNILHRNASDGSRHQLRTMNRKDDENVRHKHDVKSGSQADGDNTCVAVFNSFSKMIVRVFQKLVDVQQADFERQAKEVTDEKELSP